MSTIDLFRGAFVLLTAPGNQAWRDAARSAASHFSGLPFEIDTVDAATAAAYGISDSGVSLVRPDGFVVWRTTAVSDDAIGELRRVIAAILGR